MPQLTVSVEQDHLERLIKKPLQGLIELIWNALDADADTVTVTIEENLAGGPETVIVLDDGLGITPERAESDFGRLGGSWKSTATQTDGGRALHGRLGQGRWAAYGLGEIVRWESVADRAAGGRFRIGIAGQLSALRQFTLSDPQKVDDDEPRGTKVTVENLSEKAVKALEDPDVLSDLTTPFALYLQQYPVEVTWQGVALDPSSLQIRATPVELVVEGVEDPITLTIIEWSTRVERALHFCDAAGVSLAQIAPGIHAPGFEFTAYLTWDAFKDSAAQVLLGDMAEEPIPAIVDAAKDALRGHFKDRAAQRGAELVRAWKSDKTYPYVGEPADEVEKAERDVFEVVAVAAASAVENADVNSRRFSLRLLREALETSPDTLHLVLQEVLNLPEERQDELRTLLERTTLSAVISAARSITDRLDFLMGLEEIVFDKELKKYVKERSQLHRIMAGETWVFREEYALTADDHSLTTALRAHVDKLGRAALTPDDLTDEVLDEHGNRVVVDLMLSRVIEHDAEHRDHVVIELKRPSTHVGLEEFSQIQKYATAVAEDPRFEQTDTRWEFWIVGDSIDKAVARMANQDNRDAGIVVDSDDFVVRVVTWGSVIRAARHRLNFVRKALGYQATTDAGMDYLRKTHGRYLPAQALPGVEGPLTDEETAESSEGADPEDREAVAEGMSVVEAGPPRLVPEADDREDEDVDRINRKMDESE